MPSNIDMDVIRAVAATAPLATTEVKKQVNAIQALKDGKISYAEMRAIAG